MTKLQNIIIAWFVISFLVTLFIYSMIRIFKIIKGHKKRTKEYEETIKKLLVNR